VRDEQRETKNRYRQTRVSALPAKEVREVKHLAFGLFEEPKKPLSFDAIRISLASPEKIQEWSHGEVKKPETINYRTFKPEKEGLFCAKIFGPIKDYECLCGKYKRMKHRGITCEKCGVEVIPSRVRRSRLGHIDLATPVAHIWFFKNLPCYIGLLLDISTKEVERIIYYEAYVVVDPGNSDLEKGAVITEDQYRKLVSEGCKIDAGMGAETLKRMLENLDMEALRNKLRNELHNTKSEAKRMKMAKRLRVIEAFISSGNQPEWMILEKIPVLPPDLRPLVPLDGGRFATSDLNDLYRRVINRNNRLRRLMELNAPEIIIRNEKRMLQEAVDALFDNGRRGKAVAGPNKRPLKSLSDMLRGKQGRFRQNLLGKRVDYSGRTVIVIGPELRLHQCGLPKKMALELFKPFIFAKLEERALATSIKAAKKMVEKEEPVVFDILEEVIREHPVLLNRAPTLHRLGIQGFEPLLIEGKAIQLHPLVCQAFNADFDGDQMAVHVPLSLEAQVESRALIMSTNNILSPAHGKPIIGPTQDIVLGIYYLTRENPYAKGANKAFSSPEEVQMAYAQNDIDLHATIKVRLSPEARTIVTTTTGRILLYEICPKQIPFEMVNRVMKRKELDELVYYCYRHAGLKETVLLSDRLRTLGYKFATTAGLSICIDDLKTPAEKEKILKKTQDKVREIERQYHNQIITAGERYNKLVDLWGKATEELAEALTRELSKDKVKMEDGSEKDIESFNPIYMMVDSGARGSGQQVRQLCGMRGLMAKPSGEIIETPITASFREGLSVLQYFVSTHGARKGLADTALKTANSGYLTRRLVDIAQDVMITIPDCGTMDGIEMTPLYEAGKVIIPISERVVGRTALREIRDHLGKVIVKAGEIIDEEAAKKIEQEGIERVFIRSLLTCQAPWGVCAECYGIDLARGHKVHLGEAVGVIAAQSIGEPGTQLTMRTFHIGGAAAGQAEQSTHTASVSGTIKFVDIKTATKKDGKQIAMSRNGQIFILDENGREREKFPIVYGAQLLVKDGQKVKAGELIAEWDPYSTPFITEVNGRIKFGDVIEHVTMEEQTDERTGLSTKVIIPSKRADLQPRISIKDPQGKTIKLPGTDNFARYYLPIGAHLIVQEGQEVSAGDVIAKIPRETAKTKDITGGLPRVVELFEARKPKKAAVISEIDGIVEFAPEQKGKRAIIVRPSTGEPKTYLIPKGKALAVHKGDFVKAGDKLTEGSPNPHDILSIKKEKELGKFLVDQVQQVYKLQGVRINDKHFEAIVRQMLKRVKIVDPGDSQFLVGDLVEKQDFNKLTEEMIKRGQKPATAEPALFGITKAALITDSFISSASFQETTRSLTEAAVYGKIDYLRGLKENVIVGRLIPAGTGMEIYRDVDIEVEEEVEKGVEAKS